MCKMSNAMALELLLGGCRLCIEFELLLRDGFVLCFIYYCETVGFVSCQMLCLYSYYWGT